MVLKFLVIRNIFKRIKFQKFKDKNILTEKWLKFSDNTKKSFLALKNKDIVSNLC